MPASPHRKEQFPRRSLELTAAEWEALERLAIEFLAANRLSKPSWRVLIRHIATGQIVLAKGNLYDK